ncbi:hypothetical protein SAMN02745823_02174 [Sporobacter termitidis DSM 10068]|uniref:Probable membrane transporter protein n=1 Tax=Sporobacter termitidis DSM 10068 TaxID=1123282 RepID=A0A1M5Y3E5_9FIRM|nr:TSUP family transporter [Sporobacter termitidis]SHI06328.1 hypothetical protein SAMN02745823_02174 [Sporobacter termitidis DSM 10068]
MPDKIKAAVTGALAGALNGFFGGGGGMILVPLFICWLKVDERKTFATSVFIILPLCLVSAAVYYFRSHLDLLQALPFLIGGLAGGFIGGRVFGKIPTKLLHRLFGLLLIYGGVRCLISS